MSSHTPSQAGPSRDAVVVSSQGKTITPPHIRPSASSELKPGPEVVRRDDSLGRVQGRIFIGPMPQQVVPAPLPAPSRDQKRRRRWSIGPSLHREGTDLGIDIDNIDDEHVFRYFISRGGKEEDWTQEADISARREMVRRWRETGWATVRAARRAKSKNKQASPAPKWVGTTFKVGDLVVPAVDLNNESDHESSATNPGLLSPRPKAIPHS